MHKIFSFIVMLCTALFLSGCFSPTESLPSVIDPGSVVGESSDASVTSFDETSSAKSDSSASTTDEINTASEAASSSEQSVFEPPTAPDNDIPEYITDIHDPLSGNYRFHPNLLYIHNDRYYAEFIPENEPKILWQTLVPASPEKKYSREDALAYARANWGTHIGLCADFLSHCLVAGGITEPTESSTSITLQLLNSGLGFGQFIPINDDHTITLPDYALAGDVVQAYCPYEGMSIHSLLYARSDDKGHMCVYCHNFAENGTVAHKVVDLCYDCYIPIKEAFFFHFYDENDANFPDFPEQVKNNGGNTVLFENSGYRLSGTYDRQTAAEYAKTHPEDGLWAYGALNLSDTFNKAGLKLRYPNGSALFIQTLRSRHGSATSLEINANRTVTLPSFAEAGDAAFVYCPEDGEIMSTFLVAGKDEYGRMLAYSTDLLNEPSSAFKVDSECMLCGGEIDKVILYHFE